MRRLAIRLLFLPTLLYNLVLNRLRPERRWWDRIDPHVILGALPLPRMVERLAEEGVRAVVNTCGEWRGPLAQYAVHGITQLHVPTLDFTPPTLADIQRAVAFITEHRARGETVYVHCKAGRGRSATVALCWLVADRGWSPRQAQQYLQGLRPHINRGISERAVVAEFVRALPAR